MTMPKAFDCVEMKRQGQRRLQELLKGMPVQQQIEWWRKRNEKFTREQERLRTQRATAPAAPAPGR